MSARTAHERWLHQLPATWTIRTIGEIGRVIGGSTPSRTVPRYWGGGLPWVTPGELTGLNTKYLRSTRERISQNGLDSCGAQLLPQNALLVTSRATIGTAALTGTRIATNQGFKSVVFNGAASSPDFYYHLFKRLIPELERRASGTTFLEISSRQFAAVQAPEPPLPEQRQIAAIFDTIDEAIHKTEQIIAKLKQVKQGLLHDLLTRGIDDNGEARDPERHPEQFKDSGLGQIPRVWHCATVAELLSTGVLLQVQDGNHGESHPKREDFVAEGVPFIMANNLREGRVDVESCYKISRRQYSSLRVGFAAPGDVLLSHKGTMGQTAVVDDDLRELMLTPQVTYYRPDPARLQSSYLATWFSGNVFQRQLSALSAQSTRNFLSITGQRQLLLALPPPQEQSLIAAGVKNTNRRLLHEEREAAKLRLLKQGLMEDLLTGRVRVTPLLEGTSP